MHVIIFRHGPAGNADAEVWPDDADRPLTTGGKKKTRLVAAGLRRTGVRLDAVLTSPYRRAWQTARIVSEEFGLDAEGLAECGELRPGQSVASLEERLAELHDALGDEGAVALVGHQPDLGRLACRWLGVAGTGGWDIKKAGALHLRVGWLPAAVPDGGTDGGVPTGEPGLPVVHAALVAAYPPRVLRMLARR